ncbi:MAG: hemolysin family protein [Nitriliruptorales bacterium]|nr:hemolysin family protein [Nitriliruptorales bacterium]
MTGTELVLLAVVVLLLFATAFLAAAETVVDRLSLVRALRLAEEEEPGAEPLLWLIEHRATALNVVLALTVSVRIALAVLATVLVMGWMATEVAVIVAIVVLIVTSLALAEVAPRTLVLRDLEPAGLRIARLMSPLVRLGEPFSAVFVTLGRVLVRTRRDVSGPYPDEEELRDLLAPEDEDEEIEEDERAMIHSIFELGDTVVREIMVPRPDMIAVDESATLRELVNEVIEHGYSRIPVYRETRDDIVGVVYAKDLLKRLAMRPGGTRWNDLIREPTFVPETKRVDDLLRTLQERTVHLAIVVDEYGAMVGLVTIEDILEEIVGEIVDEHDHEAPLIEMLDDGHVRVDARLPVDELNELMDTELPDEDWDTVGGLVLGTLGRVPAEGETLDIDGLHIFTERVQGRRVSKVVVNRRDEPEPEPETVT